MFSHQIEKALEQLDVLKSGEILAPTEEVEIDNVPLGHKFFETCEENRVDKYDSSLSYTLAFILFGDKCLIEELYRSKQGLEVLNIIDEISDSIENGKLGLINKASMCHESRKAIDLMSQYQKVVGLGSGSQNEYQLALIQSLQEGSFENDNYQDDKIRPLKRAFLCFCAELKTTGKYENIEKAKALFLDEYSNALPKGPFDADFFGEPTC